ncbi:hypothetical protein AL504_31705 [Achromobacter xylosoxidans]|uniref:Uncharacterized protein n=1 Tax=Alcaligenes xylosoxydans xylosoxydans TaxID=85698 RepID=A0A2L0PUA6_ALCXX|nr:hypothetical protein AL504_31705 [Achromobacter xylosoxidans]
MRARRWTRSRPSRCTTRRPTARPRRPRPDPRRRPRCHRGRTAPPSFNPPRRPRRAGSSAGA